ncbi:hypothetical protein Syun_028471 [Stephania yunnanensis]|uniref:TATA-binding protein-associated factor BTAF1 n=1 Tax=Stephania yunnanensis TaxID=152371 RepID=A0AAP0EJZ2_9MAGN
MAQQSSRLHRLLTLLDTGSTQATRFAAARQIGDIAKSHPQDLNSLLKKVSQYLRSKSWDTRVAAAHAIGAISENVKHTCLNELFSFIESEISKAGISFSVEDVVTSFRKSHPDIAAGLSFRSFDIAKVLEFGALLASGGQEYDIANENGKNPTERLARQKQNLRRRLGLNGCEQFMDVNDMIADEDLLENKPNSHMVHSYIIPGHGNHIRQLVANMVPNFSSKRPSARELNLLKRKAKINAKDQTKVWSEDGEFELSTSQSSTVPNSSGSNKASINGVLDEESFEYDGDGRWPFQSFVEQLTLDMFDPIWEVRHGSMMALREILMHQGGSAGVVSPDLCSNNNFLFEMGNGQKAVAVKRERALDLNVQDAQESESDMKRLKLEGDLTYNSTSMTGDVSSDIYVKLEDGRASSTSLQVNGVHNIVSIKNEPHIYPDDLEVPSNEDIDTFEENLIDSRSISKVNTMKDISGNCKMMKVVNLTRLSWIKNWEFLQDCAIRFLCGLALDRFGDYVSDQVVAPVRETCAQALGAVLKYMHPFLVHETLNILLQMQFRSEWEIRHGSMLGIKYLVAVRQDLLHDLLGQVLPACKVGLEDPDDDVRAVAADALIPAVASIVSLNGPMLHSIVMLLWDILLDLDDLKIYSQEHIIPNMMGSLVMKERQGLDLNEVVGVNENEGIKSEENPYMLPTLAPRLWPFMRHSIASVRKSAICTLELLLEAGKRLYESTACSFWPSFILGDALRIVFQNLLLEANEEIVQCSDRVWRLLLQGPETDLEVVARSYFSDWTELASTSYGSPLDVTKMFWPEALPRKSQFRAAAKMRAAKLENTHNGNYDFDCGKGINIQNKHEVVPTGVMKIIVGSDGEKSVTQTRVVTATALGVLASKLSHGSLRFVTDSLWRDLTSLSGVQRQVASMIIVSWFRELHLNSLSGSQDVKVGVADCLRKWLLELLACTEPAFPTKDSQLPYSELSRTYSKMRSEANLLFTTINSSEALKDMSADVIHPDTVSVDDVINFASKLSLPISQLSGKENVEKQVLDDLDSLRQRLLTTSGYLKCVQSNLHVTVSSLVAAAVVWMFDLPPKLNPIILPLMASIRREQEENFQEKAAEALAELISQCIARRPGPNDKLVKNICSLTYMDPEETPHAAVINSMEIIEEQDLLFLGKGTSNLKTKVHSTASTEDRSRVEGFITRRGSELALKHLCKKFGATLFEKVPKLWDCLTEVLKPENPSGVPPSEITVDSVEDPQILINNIQVLRSVAPLLDETLKPRLLSLLPCIFRCVCHTHVAVRLAASRCITTMTKSMTVNMMGAVIEKAIPMLGDRSCIYGRQGAGMLLCLLVQGLGVELVPYAPLLVVPLLRCMSDSDPAVRQIVTHSFAALVPLLPLARGLPPPVGLNEDISRNKEDAQFLEQLLDNSHIDDYKLSIELKVTLRRYQQEGVNWLSFLRRFKLHGILCDDMGLGKTLQALAMVASDLAEFRALNNGKNLLSLIICPSTLVGHWAYEIEKYIDTSLLTPLQYVGSAQDRISHQSHFEKHNVIITSYDVVRKDIDYLGQLNWNYCILDEGHIIKNSKSKVTNAVKQLKAEHRLILSGTPIQNNILELWSLFDFLMPGFLGTERQFQARYGKPLLASRDSKCSAKDAEAGVLAMEALHKQVMPFLLRRTKDEVLSDLPEKIIQDRYCDLSAVQLKLYEQFSSSDAKKDISTLVTANESPDTIEPNNTSPKASSHIFQAIQYLLKLCSHPLLVMGEKFIDSALKLLKDIITGTSDIISDLHQLHHSPKLVALKEILEECGIGLDASNSESAIGVGQHRVLIFAQHKALLDIIERDLFQTHMKSVTYLRLDGSVEPEKRFEIVKNFNSDPTIDVLLLTTHVGGLGLNLTSADTLVFMEHDWNPMRDYQAMDRAHRLGQRKVVNVHRLIMRGTLEEKVMSLQKFKVSISMLSSMLRMQVSRL